MQTPNLKMLSMRFARLLVAWIAGNLLSLPLLGQQEFPPLGKSPNGNPNPIGNQLPGVSPSGLPGVGVVPQNGAAGLGSVPAVDQKPVTEEAVVTVESVQATLNQLNASAELEVNLKQQLVAAYESLLAELKERAENEKFYKELVAAFEAAPSATSEAKRRKESPNYPTIFESGFLPNASIEQLQALQTELQTLLQTASDRKASVEAAVVTRDSKKKEIPKLLSDAKAAITKLGEEINAPAPEGIDPRLREATQLVQKTRLIKLNERVRRLEQEQRTYDTESELLTLRKENTTTEQKHYQAKLKEVVAELGQRRESRVIQHKRMAMVFAERADARLRPEAEKLLQRCDSWLNLIRSSAGVQLAADATEADFKRWDERFRIMSNKIAPQSATQFTNFNSIVGFMLRKQRAELPDPTKLRYRLAEYQQQMLSAQTLILELEDWNAAALVDTKITVPEYEQQLSDRLLDISVEEQRRLLMAMEKQIVDGYRVDLNSHFDSLFGLAVRTEEHITQVNNYRTFIDEHVLWIRSSDQFARSDALQVWPALTWMLGYPNWQEVGGALLQDVRKRVWLYLFVLVVVTAFALNLRRIKLEYVKQGELATQPNVTSFLPTLRAISGVVLMASVLPAALLFVGYRLYQADQGEPFTYAVGMGLMVAARYYLPLELLRRICASRGLGEAHFGWPTQATFLLRRNARWLIQIAIPAIAVVAMVTEYGEARYETSLGRIAYSVALAAYSIFLFVTMHPSKGVFNEYLSAHAGGWIDRFRYFWYGLFGLAPLALILLSLMGYHYTAVRLSMHLHTTFIALCGILLCYSVIRRWLLLRRRQILLVQARQRIEDAAKKGSNETGLETISVDRELNLAEINAQTMRLVGSTLLFASVAAVAFIWASVLPAVGVLNSIPLGWSVEGATPGERVPVTLANLLVAIPVGIMTVVAARNLPGLLEIALLQHLPIENAVRYAISTISRYAILFLGIIMTFSNLGVRWTNIQWLVAALGVGLGFGLQEIFANFVSGLILLFEQPVRVGDVITLDNTTGTVSKIRMRATTVVNFDRQELIIPNKDLITGRLLNWTLTDKTSRLVISIGISYSSDPVKACKLVEDACNEHVNVLKDPIPRAFFELMGESSLQITARLFLDDLNLRLPTQHELLVAIHEKFNREKIEVPFPQRDLHIRSIGPDVMSLFEGRVKNGVDVQRGSDSK